MSHIRGKDTGPEIILRKALWAKGLRYRLHYKVKGKPDIVFVGAKVAVFVDGCFWHGCPLHAVRPKANAEFWQKKLDANIERDARVSIELEALGWTVMRFWEHEIKEELASVIARVAEAVDQSRSAY